MSIVQDGEFIGGWRKNISLRIKASPLCFLRSRSSDFPLFLSLLPNRNLAGRHRHIVLSLCSTTKGEFFFFTRNRTIDPLLISSSLTHFPTVHSRPARARSLARSLTRSGACINIRFMLSLSLLLELSISTVPFVDPSSPEYVSLSLSRAHTLSLSLSLCFESFTRSMTTGGAGLNVPGERSPRASG